MTALLWTSVVLLTITLCEECRGSETARNNDTKTVCLRSADVVFVLDASNTIWPPDFRKQLRFVSSVIQELPIGPTSIRSGVVTFSHVVRVEFGLATYSGAAAASAAVSRVTQLGGNTRTDLALRRLRTMFNQEGRLDADRVAVVVTDGQSDDPPATARAAEDLRSDGVSLIAIGVGNKTDPKELATIASERAMAFNVENYDSLDRIKRLITTRACATEEEEEEEEEKEEKNDSTTDYDGSIQNSQGCSENPTDVLFILDSSRSITRSDFLQQLKFVKDTVAQLSISDSGARVAVLTFGDSPRLHFAFDRYSTLTDIEQAVDRIGHQAGGSTDTAGALRYARLNSFGGAGRENRRDHQTVATTAKMAIVVTDGRSDDAASTIHEARLLRDAGVVVFAIGVGAQVDARELGAIASAPSGRHVFMADSYSALDSISARLVEARCASHPGQGGDPSGKDCSTRRPADVVFALPGSVDDADTAAGLRFVSSMADRVQVGSNRIRMGLVPRLCHAVSGFALEEGTDSDRVALYVDNQRPTGRMDETAASLRYMRDISFDGVGVRGGRLEGQRGSGGGGGGEGPVEVAVVVVDGKSSRQVKPSTVGEANRLKERGVLVMVVSVGGGGKDATKTELRILAGCQKCLFSAEGYANLSQVVEPLAGVVLDHLCFIDETERDKDDVSK